jgi:hypothetical protein
MGKNPDPGSGMNIPDHFSESLDTVFSVKNTVPKFFDADPDPGSGIFLTLNPGSVIRDGKIRIRDKHPGSATLLQAQFTVLICPRMTTGTGTCPDIQSCLFFYIHISAYGGGGGGLNQVARRVGAGRAAEINVKMPRQIVG